jgi:transposase
LDDPRRR